MRRAVYLVLSILMALGLAACGGGTDNTHGSDEVSADPAMELVDWEKGEFRVQGDTIQDRELWVRQFTLLEDMAPEAGEGEAVIRNIFLGVLEHRVCRLYVFGKAGHSEGHRYVLARTELSDPAQTRFTEVDIDSIGWGSEAPVILDAWMAEPETLVLEVAGYGMDEWGELGQVEHFFSYMQEDREIDRVDIIEYLRGQDLIPEGAMIGADGFAVSDSKGMIYLRPDSMGKENPAILVLDSEGREVYRESFESMTQIADPFLTTDGELLFAVSEPGVSGSRILHFDASKEQFVTLAVLHGTDVERIVGMHGNSLFYLEKRQLVRWDYVTGKRTGVFDIGDLGVCERGSIRMDWDGQGEPRVYLRDSENQWVAELAKEEVAQDDRIECVVLSGSGIRLKETVALANRRNRNMHFSYRFLDSGNDQADSARILAEIVAGGGPDILVLSRKDMYTFARKGVLVNLDEFLSEEEKDRVLGSALSLGEEDGKIWGLPLGIEMRSILVHEDVMEKDTWTVPEFTDALESGKLEPVLLDGDSTLHASKISAFIMLQYCWQDDFFIDLANKKSHFQDGEVKKLIRLFGKREVERPDPSQIDARRYYRTFSIDRGDLEKGEEFFADQEKQGLKLIGYPNSVGNGNYLDECGMIAVNANSEHLNEIRAFFESFLDEEIQGGVASNGYLGITRTENPKLNNVLEMCVPIPEMNETIDSIFREEIEGYFSGDKSLDQCLEVIDSRVQLYLDE